MTLGGFADPLGKLERWRLVGELALERNPQDATGLIRFAVLADDDSVLGHHEVYVRPTEQPRFGSWWHPGLDELKTATRLRVSVDLTLTTRDILGRYQV